MTEPFVRLMNGDCLARMSEIDPYSVDMVMCDPPYGTTRNAWDAVIPFDLMWEACRRVCKPGAAMVFTAQSPFDKTLAASNLAALKHEWIWVKEIATGHLNARRAPMKLHETVLVFCDAAPPYHPQMRTGHKPYRATHRGQSDNYGGTPGAVSISDGDRFPVSLLKFRTEKGFHPTQKPVPLMEYLIRTYSPDGGAVLDFTMGSGTTGVAAVQSGRSFIGIEADPEHYRTAKHRIAWALDKGVESVKS